MGEWWEDEEPEVEEEALPSEGGLLGAVVVLGGLAFLAGGLDRSRRREVRRAEALVAANEELRRRQERREAALRNAARVHRYLGARTHRYQALIAGLCSAVGAIFLVVFFAHDTRVSEKGHLWWKERTVTEISVGDRLPLLLIGCTFLLVAACLAFFAIRGKRRYESNVGAVADARAEQQKRAKARALAERDPQLAREVRIGRPDLAHPYDDGGLVDVNGAPPGVLAVVLDLSDEDAARIVEARRDLGRFDVAEDLMNMAGLEPATFDRVSHRIILL